MNTDVIDRIVAAPVMVNTLPLPVDVVCRYIEVLRDEGYPALEILDRPSGAGLALLRELNDRPQRRMILVGIGTIKLERSARSAAAMRPDFLVSPAFSRRVLDVAMEAKIPYIPAVCTFQDVQDVLEAFDEHGLAPKLLKLCPVEVLTAEYVRMLGGVFSGIRFCPTGTITLETLPQWRRIACVGPPMESTFVPREWLTGGEWDRVRGRLREIRELAASAQVQM